MKLVIAEKAPAGERFAAVLGASERKNGYLEGNGWLVSWCMGHLADFLSPEGYDPKYADWRREDLPILPEEWKYEILEDCREQFTVLRELLLRDDVSEAVNACDCGREGELVFRTVYNLSGCRKPVKRFWISSMEEDAIREGFQNLKPGADYDGLYQAALCRAKADWMVGINASRLLSVLYGRTLNVGRVTSPTLTLIVQREAEIANFQPIPFYHVKMSCNGLILEGERIDVKEDAASLAAVCQKSEAVIRSIERAERIARPPELFDLSSLQQEANSLFGYTAQQTLDYAQALYERELCSYPRTDSRFLTDDMESEVSGLVTVAAMLCEFEKPTEIHSKQVCDSRKVSDHYAIVPTRKAAFKSLSSLPLGERRVLALVSLGLLQAVSAPYRWTETVLEAECAGHRFSAKGRETLKKGWKAYDTSAGETFLPGGLTEGQRIPVSMAIVITEKTSPPKHYTDGSLLVAMERAGEKDMPQDAERKGLGTAASRAGILEKLVAAGFIERQKFRNAPYIIPTPLGTTLVAVLPEALKSPRLTVEWERRLTEIKRGELAPDSFTDGIAAFVRELVETYQIVPGAETLFPPVEEAAPSDREIIGRCPRCGADVTESERGYFCENRACRFVLWKQHQFMDITLTKSVAAALLNGNRVNLTDCRPQNDGKPCHAMIFLKDDGKEANLRLDFKKWDLRA